MFLVSLISSYPSRINKSLYLDYLSVFSSISLKSFDVSVSVNTLQMGSLRDGRLMNSGIIF